MIDTDVQRALSSNVLYAPDATKLKNMLAEFYAIGNAMQTALDAAESRRFKVISISDDGREHYAGRNLEHKAALTLADELEAQSSSVLCRVEEE